MAIKEKSKKSSNNKNNADEESIEILGMSLLFKEGESFQACDDDDSEVDSLVLSKMKINADEDSVNPFSVIETRKGGRKTRRRIKGGHLRATKAERNEEEETTEFETLQSSFKKMPGHESGFHSSFSSMFSQDSLLDERCYEEEDAVTSSKD